MAQTRPAQRSASPPYVSFATFMTALDYLRSRGITSEVNNSVFPLMSGTRVSHVLLAMRFLNLIDEDGASNEPELAQLLDEKTRCATLKRLVERSYARLLSKVDLAKASPSQLDGALREYEMTGTTHRKARTFLIKAAQFSGMQVSGHLIKRTRMSATRSTKRRQTGKEIQTGAQNTGTVFSPPPKTFSRSVRLPEAAGTLTLSGDFDPFALRGPERDLVYRVIDLLDEFDGNRGTAKE